MYEIFSMPYGCRSRLIFDIRNDFLKLLVGEFLCLCEWVVCDMQGLCREGLFGNCNSKIIIIIIIIINKQIKIIIKKYIHQNNNNNNS